MSKGGLEKPVFIVGVPRSGTTMLWSLLLRHPDFKGKKEITSWNAETSIFYKFPKILNGFFAPNEWPFWYEYFVGDRQEFESWVIECARNFIIKATKARGAKRPLEKTPNHLENIDLVEKSFPKAKIIHIVRHPLDVFASMRKRSFITPHTRDPWLRTNARIFVDDYKRKIINIQQYKGKLGIMTIRYEDLTKDAETYVIKICRFLNIAIDIRIIYGAKPTKKIRKFPLQSHVPIVNSELWRNIVSDKEALFITKATKTVRDFFNYE